MKENMLRTVKGTKIVYHAHKTSPGLTDSNVFGTIGFPASSFKAEIFAAHRTVATLRKTELFAICLPTQILLSEVSLITPATW